MSIIKTPHPVSLVHNSNRMFLNSFTFYISPANGSPFTVNSPNHIKPWPAAISQYQVHVWWWLLHIFVEQTCDYMIYNLTWERYKPVHVRICVCECVCECVCVIEWVIALCVCPTGHKWGIYVLFGHILECIARLIYFTCYFPLSLCLTLNKIYVFHMFLPVNFLPFCHFSFTLK